MKERKRCRFLWNTNRRLNLNQSSLKWYKRHHQLCTGKVLA